MIGLVIAIAGGALLLKSKSAAAAAEPDAAAPVAPDVTPLGPPNALDRLHTRGFGAPPQLDDDAAGGGGLYERLVADRQPTKLPKFTDLASRDAGKLAQAVGAGAGKVLGSLGVPGSGLIGQGIGAIADSLGIGDSRWSAQQMAYMTKPDGTLDPAKVLALEGVDGSKVLGNYQDGTDRRVGGNSGPLTAAAPFKAPEPIFRAAPSFRTLE